MSVALRWIVRLVVLAMTGAAFFGIGFAVSGFNAGLAVCGFAVFAALPYVLVLDWKA